MAKEIILYLTALVSLVIFMLLIDRNIKWKNKALIALAAPFVGGLFVLLGSIFFVFLFALIIFGGLFYLFNKGRFKKWLGRLPHSGVYRYYSLF